MIGRTEAVDERIARLPYFTADGVVLFRGDALAVLRDLPTGSAQACLTDPPYGERVASWDGPRCREWYVAWLREVNRVVVPNGPILSFASRRRLDVVMTALREVAATSPAVPCRRSRGSTPKGSGPRRGTCVQNTRPSS